MRQEFQDARSRLAKVSRKHSFFTLYLIGPITTTLRSYCLLYWLHCPGALTVLIRVPEALSITKTVKTLGLVWTTSPDVWRVGLLSMMEQMAAAERSKGPVKVPVAAGVAVNDDLPAAAAAVAAAAAAVTLEVTLSVIRGIAPPEGLWMVESHTWLSARKVEVLAPVPEIPA